jgi:hypothetical protein
MKTARNLSGIKVRFKNPETNTYENRCFEDLPHQEQLNLLAGKEQSWILSLAIDLADTLNRIGEEFNIESK